MKRKHIFSALVVIGVAIVGTYLITASHASTPYASVEAASGTLASGATVLKSSSASDGSYAQFDSAPQTGCNGGCFTNIYSQWSNGPDPGASPAYFPVAVFYQDFGRPAPAFGNEDSVIAYDSLGINMDVNGYDCDNGGCPNGARDPNIVGAVNDNSSAHPVNCGCDVFGTSASDHLTDGYPYTNGTYAPTGYQAMSLFSADTATNGNHSTVGAAIKENYISGADEADMNEPDDPPGSSIASPELNQQYADIKAADPTRPTYVGYGKCFSIPDWNGCQAAKYNGAGESEEASLKQYCANTDMVASDYYADAASIGTGPGNNYSYGQTIDNEASICGANHVLGFDIETGEINGSPDISTADIEAATWDGIMQGAHLLVYFVDDIASNGGELVENGLLTTAHAAAADQVKADDDMISALAPWLNSPSLSGVSVTSTGGIPIVTMLKEYNGQTYLFAFADGNSSHPYSGSTTATITLPSSDNFANAARDSAISYNNDTTTGSGASAGQPHSGTITTDSGSVQITSNRFSDSFLPYELHVYQLY